MESPYLSGADSPQRSFASSATLLVAAVGLGITYLLGTVVYNVYFHPLCRFPGPRLNAMTRLPHALSMLSGRDHLNKYDYHMKYGHFVRVAPNILSISHPDGMRVVRGFKKAGHENSRDPVAMHGFEKNLIGADQHQHGVYRRILASGFSNQAVAEQEPLFRDFGDKLIQRLRDACQDTSNAAAGVDVGSWYNWATFDVIGTLAFGESFGCLDDQNYHPWVANIFANLKDRAFQAQALYSGRFLAPILMKLFLPRELVGKAQYHNQLSAEKVRKRLATEPASPDYVSAMVAGKGKSQGMSFEELVSHASVLTIAGSETSATTLTAATYYLTRHPEYLAKVQAEVRNAFFNEDEISLDCQKHIPYLQAVIEETLRMFPAAILPSARVIGKSGETVADKHIPPGTLVENPIWVINHHPELFVRPFEFRPERWIPGNEAYENDRLDACMPFGYGPRVCLGKHLAYAELRMLMAKMLWNFDMELPAEMENWADECKGYVVWEKGPLYVRLMPKEKA